MQSNDIYVKAAKFGKQWHDQAKHTPKTQWLKLMSSKSDPTLLSDNLLACLNTHFPPDIVNKAVVT